MKSINIIIPCYNEEESINYLFENLAELERNVSTTYELSYTFVNDGSTDDTEKLISSKIASSNNAKLINHETNKNLGGALQTGIKEAPNTDYLAFLDSDSTYSPLVIIELINEIEKGHDLVTVSPYHPMGEVEGVPAWRLFLSKGISLIYQILLRKKLYTFTAMVRIIKRDKVDAIMSDKYDFTFVTEMMLNAIKQKYSIIEIPAVLKTRLYGVSKMKTLSTIQSHLKIVAKLLLGKKL